MTFNERFESLLRSRKLTKAAIADNLGIRRQIFTEWKTNGNLPRMDIATKIAQFLGVSVEYLLTGINEEKNSITDEEMEIVNKYRAGQLQQESEYTEEEKKLISLWRALTDDQKDDVMHEMEYKSEKNLKESLKARA